MWWWGSEGQSWLHTQPTGGGWLRAQWEATAQSLLSKVIDSQATILVTSMKSAFDFCPLVMGILLCIYLPSLGSFGLLLRAPSTEARCGIETYVLFLRILL